MARCDGCHKDYTTEPVILYRTGSERLCQTCYGTPRMNPLNLDIKYKPVVFDAYYDPLLKREIKSWKEQREAGEKFRSDDHKEGLSLHEDTPYHKELTYIRKHKEDFRQETHKKQGIKYQPGSGGKWNDTKHDFVDSRGNSLSNRKYFSMR